MIRRLRIAWLEGALADLGAQEIIAGERMRTERERGNRDLALYHFARMTKITHRRELVRKKLVRLTNRKA